jgi:hypothetical protein
VKCFVRSLFLILPFLSPVVHADDWGCQVLLCLSNPQGPKAVRECEPPINRLWRDLSKGRPFPTCDTGGSSGASHSWASTSNCPPQYIRYTVEESPKPYCLYAGAVSTTMNNQPYTRVWWNTGDTVTETFGEASNVPGASRRYEQDYAVWKAEQDRLEAERQRSSYYSN